MRMVAEMQSYLRRRHFDFLVTLSTNFSAFSSLQMRSHLKKWDAFCNRALNQRRWHDRPDERLLWLAFPEKDDVNPHWHLLLQMDPWIQNASSARQDRARRFQETAEGIWLKLVPSGSFDCTEIFDKGVVDYVTKALHQPEHIENFICSREFLHN